MRHYGDIPEDHKILVEELEILEAWFNDNEKSLPAISKAKGMVCMAHDYYTMEMEEEGERLLNIAEKHCSGYFKGPIYIHMHNDGDYCRLVEQLEMTLALGPMKQFGYSDE